MGAAPTHSKSSIAPEEPWRVTLMNAALGLLTVATLVATTVTLVRPHPTLDALTFTMVGYLVTVGLSWRARGWTMRTRALGATLPALVVAQLLVSRSGFFPNVSLALAILATLLSIWVGARAAFLFVIAASMDLLVGGVLLVTRHPPLDLETVDPYHLANWIRVAVNFAGFAGVMAWSVHWVVQKVEQHAAERESAHQLLRLVHRRLESAQEDERRHLARELHDELGQVLTALKLRIKLAGRSAPDAAPALDEAVGLVDGLIAQVRKLSVDLSPPLLEEAGLEAAIRAHLGGHAGLAGVDVDLEVSLPSRLRAELEVAAFRVVQESLTNVARHAAAKHVSVRVLHEAGSLVVAVGDDGRGFDVSAALRAAATGAHLGVVGMKERIRGLGGSLEVESSLGGGTLVHATLPVTLADVTHSRQEETP
jgi:signal transduction histidine kinase